MDKRKLSNMLLILTALIWGSAFVAQSIGTAKLILITVVFRTWEVVAMEEVEEIE